MSKFINLVRSNLMIFLIIVCAFYGLLRSNCLPSGCKSIILYLKILLFRVLAFTFKWSILIFLLWCDIRSRFFVVVFFFNFFIQLSSCSSTICWIDFLPYSDHFVPYQKSKGSKRGYLWFHRLFICLYANIMDFDYCSFIVSHKIR